MFTKKQEQKDVTVYFVHTYMQNMAPGIVTYAQIHFSLRSTTGGEYYSDSGRYPTLNLSSRPSLKVPPGTYEVGFTCSNIWVRPLGESNDGYGYGVSGYAVYDNPETITVTGDNNSETVTVNVNIRK